MLEPAKTVPTWRDSPDMTLIKLYIFRYDHMKQLMIRWITRYRKFWSVFWNVMYYSTIRGADSVKLPRSMKIPPKAAALWLPMTSLCFLSKLALWSLLDNGFTYLQWLKQVLLHIYQVFIKVTSHLSHKNVSCYSSLPLCYTYLPFSMFSPPFAAPGGCPAA